MRPAALLFDLDGTLADSFAGIRAAANCALAEAGLPVHELAWYVAHVGRGATALILDAVGGDPERARAVEQGFARHYAASYLETTPPLPGARQVLAFVAARLPRRVAVVSNKHARLCRGWLEHWGMAGYVDAVSGPDTAGVTKPDPGSVLPLLDGFGVAPEDALLVGDMLVDAATAAAAGVPMVAVTPHGCSEAEMRAAGALDVLGRLGDLPAWLVARGDGWR